MTPGLQDAMVMSRGGVLRWKHNNQPVVPDDLVEWFDRAYPEPWHVKAARLRAASDETLTWQVGHRGFNRGHYRGRRAAA